MNRACPNMLDSTRFRARHAGRPGIHVVVCWQESEKANCVSILLVRSGESTTAGVRCWWIDLVGRLPSTPRDGRRISTCRGQLPLGRSMVVTTIVDPTHSPATMGEPMAARPMGLVPEARSNAVRSTARRDGTYSPRAGAQLIAATCCLAGLTVKTRSVHSSRSASHVLQESTLLLLRRGRSLVSNGSLIKPPISRSPESLTSCKHSLTHAPTSKRIAGPNSSLQRTVVYSARR